MTPENQKIMKREEIARLTERLHREGKKIVTCNGSYDLLHIGHIKFLQEARAQGDVLIVGVNSNASVKKYKGKNRPIVDELMRAEGVAALQCVDYVVIMDEAEIAVPLVKMVKPDVHVNGEEYGKDCIEAPAVKEAGGSLHLVKKVPGFSTTELIGRIVTIFGKNKTNNK